MQLALQDGFSISDIRPGDEPAFVEWMRDREIYERTLNIPFPYTEQCAREWVALNVEEGRRLGQTVKWCIRRPDGYVVGGIGFHDFELGKSHRAEIGYWLAKPLWGQGVMSRAVAAAVELGFAKLGLARITANVFAHNVGSARVLEKNGFRLEGELRSHYKKDGKLFDGRLYARLRTD